MIQTTYDIGDEVWFFLHDGPDDHYGRIGRGKIYRIYVTHDDNQHNELYDIDGIYDTDIMSGIRHMRINPWYIRKTKEEIDKIDFWH